MDTPNIYRTYPAVGNEKGFTFGASVTDASRKDAAKTRNSFLQEKTSGGQQTWTAVFTQFPSGKMVKQTQASPVS
jgi:hypothetical protein